MSKKTSNESTSEEGKKILNDLAIRKDKLINYEQHDYKLTYYKDLEEDKKIRAQWSSWSKYNRKCKEYNRFCIGVLKYKGCHISQVYVLLDKKTYTKYTQALKTVKETLHKKRKLNTKIIDTIAQELVPLVNKADTLKEIEEDLKTGVTLKGVTEVIRICMLVIHHSVKTNQHIMYIDTSTAEKKGIELYQIDSNKIKYVASPYQNNDKIETIYKIDKEYTSLYQKMLRENDFILLSREEYKAQGRRTGVKMKTYKNNQNNISLLMYITKGNISIKETCVRDTMLGELLTTYNIKYTSDLKPQRVDTEYLLECDINDIKSIKLDEVEHTEPFKKCILENGTYDFYTLGNTDKGLVAYNDKKLIANRHKGLKIEQQAEMEGRKITIEFIDTSKPTMFINLGEQSY